MSVRPKQSGCPREKSMEGKVATILRKRRELEQWQRRLNNLTVKYLRLNIGTKSWREMATLLHTDVSNLHRFARQNGLIK
jgi:hypothetical protein